MSPIRKNMGKSHICSQAPNLTVQVKDLSYHLELQESQRLPHYLANKPDLAGSVRLRTLSLIPVRYITFGA